VIVASGCGLATQTGAPATPVQANPGEQKGSIPAKPGQPAPRDPARTPEQALERFTDSYINWSYATLEADQAHLAAIAVGEARASEEQARARTKGDSPLRRARIYNKGTIIAIAPLRGGGPQEWVICTREQTGGNSEYAELQAGFHLTIATVQRVSGGWAVSAWRPQV
jgi:hypothetical protein